MSMITGSFAGGLGDDVNPGVDQAAIMAMVAAQVQQQLQAQQAQQAGQPVPALNFTNRPTPPVFNTNPTAYTNSANPPLQQQGTDPSGNMYSSSPYAQLAMNARRRRAHSRRGMRHAARSQMLDDLRRRGQLHGLGNVEILDADLEGAVGPTARKVLWVAGAALTLGLAAYVTRKVARRR